MGKSSKPQVTTQSGNTTQVMQMPAYVQSAQQNLLGTGQDILSPYLNAGTSGYGVAGFNNDQQTAFQGVRDNYANAMAGGGGIGGADIQKFLNPYTQNVVDTTNQTLRDQNDITLNGIRARTAAASSFGGSGSRGALQESEANRNLGSTMASTTAQLMAAGYDRAAATALASKQMDTAARQAAIDAQFKAGNVQQALAQTQLDVPRTALQQLLALTPQQYGSTTTGTNNSTTVGPPPQTPSGLQQGLGAGLSILGMGTGAGTTLGGSLFSGLASAAPALLALSDRTTKTDIEKLGKDDQTGLDVYSYRYKGDPKNTPKVVGPMAQDIEKRFPGTTQKVGGKLAVNVTALQQLLGVS